MAASTEALELGLLNLCFLYSASNSPIYGGDRCPLITTSLDISSHGPTCLTGESLETRLCLVSSKHPALIRCQRHYEEPHQSPWTHIHENRLEHTYALQTISTIWLHSVPVFMTVIVLRCNYTLISLQFLETEWWIHFCMCYFNMFTRNLM